MKYKVICLFGGRCVEAVFIDLAEAKVFYSQCLSRHLKDGHAFTCCMFSGVADKHGVFWHHQCIATFDYDGDASIQEADNE